jgi:hypothetical protein
MNTMDIMNRSMEEAQVSNCSLLSNPAFAQRSLAVRRQRLILAQRQNQMNPKKLADPTVILAKIM